MTTNRMPARVVSPGRMIEKELEARGWTQRDLAAIMGRPYQAINEVIKGVKQITPDTARELAMAFGTSMEFWMNLEANYRVFLAAQEDKEREIERRSRLYTIAPITDLTKRGWIKGSQNIDELENQVCSFLGISSPSETPKAFAQLRISESFGPDEAAKIAWIKRVEQLAAIQLVGEFSRKNLLEAIPHILKLTEKPEDVQYLPKYFSNVGVHFLVVPHLPHTYLDGAAFFVNKNPVIAVTLRHDRIDWFWFTVLHELAHIVRGHSAQLDSLFGEKEINEIESSKELENQANEKAREWLLNTKELDAFIKHVSPFFSKGKIEQFAAQQQRHPGIVLGQLQYKGVIEYKNLRSLLVKVRPHLEDWVDKPILQ